MLYEIFKTLIIRFVIIYQKTISKCITFLNKPVRNCKHWSMVGMRSNQVSHWIGWFFPGKSSPARFTASSSLQIRKLPILIKQGLQKYCETPYLRIGVNQIWILNNSKELLEHLQSQNFNHITSIKSFDFSTLYTTIPHQKLKSRLATIIRNSFIHGPEGPYFVKEHSDSKNKYTKDDIINMLEILVDNIFVVFGEKGFSTGSRHSNGHKLCPSPSRHISVLIRSGIHTVFALNWKEKKLASQFNFTYIVQIHRWRIVNQ